MEARGRGSEVRDLGGANVTRGSAAGPRETAARSERTSWMRKSLEPRSAELRVGPPSGGLARREVGETARGEAPAERRGSLPGGANL